MSVPRQIALAAWACFASVCTLIAVASTWDVTDWIAPLIDLQAIGVFVLGVWGIVVSLRRGDGWAGFASSAVVVTFPLVVLAYATTLDWQ
jgi:hypothetical protein